jgi:hypothetical protein
MGGRPKAIPKKSDTPVKTTGQAIAELEKALHDQRLLVYIQDWMIGPWDIPRIFGLLSGVGKVDNLNLIIDSRGGYPDDAYKIADVIHEFCKSLTVIVPVKAKSAATLLSLAGHQIQMGPLSELGPCDPMIYVDESLITPTAVPFRPPETPATDEDKSKQKKRQMNALALRDFLEAAGILIKNGDGKVSGYNCEKLVPFCEKGILNPWLLGDFERSFKQSYQFVENLLRRYMFKGDVEKLKRIPEIAHKLTEGYFLHDYPISRREAQEMGLNVIDMPDELWKQITELMTAYDIMKKEQKLCTIIETSSSYVVDKWLPPPPPVSSATPSPAVWG